MVGYHLLPFTIPMGHANSHICLVTHLTVKEGQMKLVHLVH